MRPPHVDARALARLAPLLLALAACSSSEPVVTTPSPAPSPSRQAVQLSVTSPAFEHEGAIPSRFTCEGEGVSPPLRWDPAPEGTVEWAILVDDTDAPRGAFTHWVIFGIPSRATRLEPGVAPPGAKQGLNSAGEAAWTGPCPPPGDEPHRYFFSLLALDAATGLPDGAADDDVRKAIQPHVIGHAQIMGTFGR